VQWWCEVRVQGEFVVDVVVVLEVVEHGVLLVV